EELMASLFEAIIQQNLAVLTRGNTLRPAVLLLGGPNTYIKGMQECWQANIPELWKERNVVLPDGKDPASLVQVPSNPQYFAAMGAIEYGMSEEESVCIYKGIDRLRWYIDHGRPAAKAKISSVALIRSAEDLEGFKERYRVKQFQPGRFRTGEVVEAFMG